MALNDDLLCADPLKKLFSVHSSSFSVFFICSDDGTLLKARIWVDTPTTHGLPPNAPN